MKRQSCCALLGHSPMRFRFGWDEEDSGCIRLKLVLLQQVQLLRQKGVTQFMTACDPGVGLWGGEIINCLRACDKQLQLYCVLPYEEQATKWAPYLRERYFELLDRCTHVSAVHIRKTPAAQLDAYKSIIRQSDAVLAVYDPASHRGDAVDRAIAYAEAEEKPIVLIHPDTLRVTAAAENE